MPSLIKRSVHTQATELKKLNNTLAAAQSEVRKAEEQTEECKRYWTLDKSPHYVGCAGILPPV